MTQPDNPFFGMLYARHLRYGIWEPKWILYSVHEVLKESCLLAMQILYFLKATFPSKVVYIEYIPDKLAFVCVFFVLQAMVFKPTRGKKIFPENKSVLLSCFSL